jgi:serine phosphatase RsbU (regulator of sigma subunit)
MATWGFGLRAKSMLALLLACLLALIPAGLVGWQILDGVREHFGTAYLRNFTLLKRQQILAPVSRELTLSLRLADSTLTRQWLRDENDAAKRALFFGEAEGYRRDFRSQTYFVIPASTGNYYFGDGKRESDTPSYQLQRDKKSDAWFFKTLRLSTAYDINVNYDENLKLTQIWFNALIRDGDKVLGLTGGSLDLTAFIEQFIITPEVGLTPMIVSRNGAIQAHRDIALIATNQITNSSLGELRPEQTLAGRIDRTDERERLTTALRQAEENTDEVVILPVHLDGKPQLMALAYLPELRWHIVTAMDLQAAKILDQTWARSGLILLVLLLTTLLLAFGYAVERLLLRPLKKLQQSASAIAKGDYDTPLPVASRDEMGDLSQAFGSMARQIRQHTAELEDKVAARTQALAQANQEMQRAHRQISDSIDYASLIQRTILPQQQLRQTLDDGHCVLWQPRDVVGGDFYLFREEAGCYLLGVIDCAGHGVPGALMTMLARAALDHAVNTCGISQPAAILQETDRSMRAMLRECELPRAIATNLDAGLVYVNPAQQKLRFSGAKINLYWSDGNEIGQLNAHRRAIGDRRPGIYTDQEIVLRPDVTYTLSTDGFLDQAGGEKGYGFGNSRFAELLRTNARRPMHEQAAAFNQVLADYQGTYPQRDDITVLSFRFDPNPPKNDPH